jgi:hypothetical protein
MRSSSWPGYFTNRRKKREMLIARSSFIFYKNLTKGEIQLKVWVVVKISGFEEEGILWEAAADQDISPIEERKARCYL